METILSIQPRISAAASGKSPDEIVLAMVDQFTSQLPLFLD
jgi:hypothetical protein